jgi:hypothetical protein
MTSTYTWSGTGLPIMIDILQLSPGGLRLLRAVSTRWMDNDPNEVPYYSYFDTAVNGFLIEASGIDIRDCRPLASWQSRVASSPPPRAFLIPSMPGSRWSGWGNRASSTKVAVSQ